MLNEVFVGSEGVIVACKKPAKANDQFAAGRFLVSYYFVDTNDIAGFPENYFENISEDALVFLGGEYMRSKWSN